MWLSGCLLRYYRTGISETVTSKSVSEIPFRSVVSRISLLFSGLPDKIFSRSTIQAQAMAAQPPNAYAWAHCPYHPQQPQVAAAPPAQVAFTGGPGEDVTLFIQGVQRLAFAQGRQRDEEWCSDLAVNYLAGAAMRFFVELDEEDRGSWTRLRRALARRFPPAAVLAPLAAAAAHPAVVVAARPATPVVAPQAAIRLVAAHPRPATPVRASSVAAPAPQADPPAAAASGATARIKITTDPAP